MTYQELQQKLHQADALQDTAAAKEVIAAALSAYVMAEITLSQLADFGSDFEATPLAHLSGGLASSLADLSHYTAAKDKSGLKKSLRELLAKAEVVISPDQFSDQYWQDVLTPEQYETLRKHGTEIAFTGQHYHEQNDGKYVCAACGMELFDAEHKYESGSGWPSFWQAVAADKVILQPDASLGMQRTEVICGRCKSHLGHLFEDGPQPTGERYCINSAALDFMPNDATAN